MATRTFHVPDLGPGMPLHGKALEWLKANGIDPDLVPLGSDIAVSDSEITFDEVVIDPETGASIPDYANANVDSFTVLRTVRAVPLVAAPETFGL